MNRRGFTLLEHMVALAITLLMAGLLLTATVNLLQSWRRTQGASGAAQEAKLALDLLERDLQGAILRADSKVWLDARVVDGNSLTAHGWDLSGAGIVKPEGASERFDPPNRADGTSNIADARFGRSGMWLRLVVFEREGSASALPMAIGYQIVRRNFGSAANPVRRYGLFRNRLSAPLTFSEVLGSGFAAAAPEALNQPNLSDLLLGNVVDFGVWIASRDALGNEQPLPTSGDFAYSVSTAPRGVVWVKVRVLTNEGAALLDAIENGRVMPPANKDRADWWWEQVEANSRVFVRRIELKGAGS